MIPGLNVIENRIIPTGQILVSEEFIALHPYTFIQVTSKTFEEELSRVIGTITHVTNALFDQRIMREKQ